MPGDLRYFIPGSSLSGHSVRAPSRNGRPHDWSPRRRRARPIPASHAEIECGICLPDIVPAHSRPGCGIGSSISFEALFPSAGYRFTGCRGRRRRQPVAAAHSGWHAHIAALAIAAITGEPDRSASLNSNGCIHFECAATPSRTLHIARALLCSPHPLGPHACSSRGGNWLVAGRPAGGFRFSTKKRQKLDGPQSRHPGLFGSHVRQSRGGNWLVVGGQLGAFASRYGSVKNWMDRRVTHPGLLVLTRNARVGATGWSLVGQPGAFASGRRSVKNWMDRGSHASRPGGKRKCALESAAGPAQRATVRYIAHCSYVTRLSPLKSRRCGWSS